MAETIDFDKKKTAERRLALLALTGEQSKPPGPCLNAEQLACLVEGRLAADIVETSLVHLADCDQCYATWRQLDQEWQHQVKSKRPGKLLKWFNRPRLLATTGSILALAASIAVFLNITMQADRDSLLRFPDKPTQEQKQIAPPLKPLPARPQTLEPTAAAPAPQQLETKREQKVPSRTDHMQGKEKEAIAPAMSADEAASARQTSRPAARIQPAEQVAMSYADKLTENKERTSGMVAKEAAPIPAPPQQATRAAGDQSADTGAELLPLTEWQRMIRQGCQGQPGPDFFAAITAQGKQLQAMQDALMSTEDRQQVSRILTLLTNRPQHRTEQQCQALLELLGPAAEKNRP